MTLAGRLREATQALHAEAERSGVMRELLRGALPRTHYCALLRALHAIYGALEPALASHAGHRWLAPIHEPRLWRCEALAADLLSLHGADWAEAITVAATAQRYAERLGQLARTAPARLVAHAYTRYLGDLSGGQILSGIVARSYRLPAAAGRAFYTFGAPGAAALAQHFRDGLDALPDDAAAAAQIIDEARLAFALHVELFAELAAPA